MHTSLAIPTCSSSPVATYIATYDCFMILLTLVTGVISSHLYGIQLSWLVTRTWLDDFVYGRYMGGFHKWALKSSILNSLFHYTLCQAYKKLWNITILKYRWNRIKPHRKEPFISVDIYRWIEPTSYGGELRNPAPPKGWYFNPRNHGMFTINCWFCNHPQ